MCATQTKHNLMKVYLHATQQTDTNTREVIRVQGKSAVKSRFLTSREDSDEGMNIGVRE